MRIGQTIYFDHQATTPVDSRVLKAMTPYLEESFGNPHSADHVLGWAAARAVDESAARVASLLGVDSDEIIFTSGATEANNLALMGIARRAAGGKRGRILCSAIEHKCVLAAAQAVQDQLAYKVELLPVDHDGCIKMQRLEDALDENVLLVSIVAVNNEIGTIQNVQEISRLVESVGALLHCDAAQAPCAMELQSIGQFVHLLSLSAHKIYAPKGIGALFARRELHNQIEPIIYGGGQQKNLRSGTVPTALCVGMGAATDLLLGDEAARERQVVRQLRDHFIEGLRQLSWPIRVNGPKGPERHPGNANICFEGFSAHDILGAMQPRLAASTGSACTSGTPEPSYVLRAIGLSTEDAGASIRFSLGRHSTASDVDEAVGIIARTLSELSRVGLMRMA